MLKDEEIREIRKRLEHREDYPSKQAYWDYWSAHDIAALIADWEELHAEVERLREIISLQNKILLRQRLRELNENGAQLIDAFSEDRGKITLSPPEDQLPTIEEMSGFADITGGTDYGQG